MNSHTTTHAPLTPPFRLAQSSGALVEKSHGTLSARVFLILLGLTAYIPVNIIGTLRVAEILALVFVLFNVKDVVSFHSQYRRMRWYFWGNFAWIAIGSISTLYNASEFPEKYFYTTPMICFAKGFANIVFVYACTMVFVKSVGKVPSLIPYYLIPNGVATLLINPYYYDLGDISKANFFAVDSSSFQDNYFDIFIAPFVSPLVISAPWLLRRRGIVVSIIMLVYGAVAVFFDARSTGLIFVLSGVAIAVKAFDMRISLKYLLFLFLFALFVCIPSLKFLASQGWLGQKGSEQALRSMDGVNVFNPVLIIGRPAATVATFAILDRPLSGHGFNKQDSQYYWAAKEAGYLPASYVERFRGISAHSNILNAMVESGVFGGLVWVLVLFFAFEGISSAFSLPYSPIGGFLIVCFFFLTWHILFSGTVRLDFGYFIAVLLVRANKKQ